MGIFIIRDSLTYNKLKNPYLALVICKINYFNINFYFVCGKIWGNRKLINKVNKSKK